MQINVIQCEDGLNHIELVGELDTNTATHCGTDFEKKILAAKSNTILDISKLSYIASLGVGQIVTVSKSLSMHGKKVILLNPSESIKKVFTLAKVDSLMPIVHSLEEAKSLLS